MIRQEVMPRYWGRCWRYRWLVYDSPPFARLGEGYAWTWRGADRAASEVVDECRAYLGRP